MSYKWVKKWKVEGSTHWGRKQPLRSIYVVSLSVDGTWGCSCKGWTMHQGRDCKHIETVKYDIKWKPNDISNLIELQALRITQLREKGKSEKEIETDMETLVWE
jgi:hypothetical protein